MLKPRIMGENPCNVDKVFRKIKQFGHHARQAGGVCGVEMALWDLAGKAYGVPAFQMLGGRFRDSVRLYADTTEAPDAIAQGKKLKARMDLGITYLKQDFGINLLQKIPGTLSMPVGYSYRQSQAVMHPFTGIEITDKGIAWLDEWVGQVRSVIGPEIPLSSDHYGHIGVNSCIKLARAMEKHNLAWMEDMVPWQFGELMKQIRDSTTTPILTGEDIYLKEEFIKLIDMGAVDMIHPDLASSGGLLETKKIGDYAMERGVAMAMHFAGTPDFVPGQRPLRGRDRELHRARTPLDRRAVVGNHGQDGEADRRKRLRQHPRSSRTRLRAERGSRQGTPASRERLLRADAAVGQGTLERSALELIDRSIWSIDRREPIATPIMKVMSRLNASLISSLPIAFVLIACVPIGSGPALDAQDDGFWAFLPEGRVVSRCVEGSAAQKDASVKLQRLDERIRGLADSTPVAQRRRRTVRTVEDGLLSCRRGNQSDSEARHRAFVEGMVERTEAAATGSQTILVTPGARRRRSS